MPLLRLSKNQNIEETESFPFSLGFSLLVHFGTPSKTIWGKFSYTNLCLILSADKVFWTVPGVFVKTVNFVSPQCSLLIKLNRATVTDAVLIFVAFL